jgi:acyl-ACP thioesterase
MQETANHQMRDKKPSYEELFKAGKAFILSRIDIRIYGDVMQYDKLDVQSWPCASKGVSFNRCYRVLRDGETMAEAVSVWALLNIADHRLCRVNEVDLSNYTYGEQLAFDGPTRFRLTPEMEEGMTLAGTRRIMYSDIDCNRHMNNTNYPDMLCDFIPDIWDRQITSMKIHFVSEAPYGETLQVYRTERDTNGVFLFRTERANGETNVAAEITAHRR